MIYTCTLNPSIDILTSCDLRLYTLNILESVSRKPSGKGINVSRELHSLGIPSTCLGFLGGSNGSWIDHALKEEGLVCDFIWIDEQSRSNLKIYDHSKCTEINQRGPTIPGTQAEELEKKISTLHAGDLLILSGSMAPGLNENYLKKLIETAHNKNGTVILDSSGAPFKQALMAHPDYIKPNDQELKALLGSRWPDESSADYIQKVCQAAKSLLETYKIKGILLSLGSKGACWIDAASALYAPALPLDQVYATGAGDSMVCALASLLYENRNQTDKTGFGEAVLKKAVLFASACCKNADDILFSREELEKLEKNYPVIIEPVIL